MSNHSIVVTHRDSLAFVVRIGDHWLVTDQPPSNGGAGAGPEPLDFLSAGLGACVAFYVHQFCAARNIPHEGIRIEVRSHKLMGPSRLGGFDVHVVLPPDTPPHDAALIERVVRSCPAHNTFVHGADVKVETTVAAGAGSSLS